ncbi:hypothetical protein QBC43DRAFT_339013 [Cladorrhinum sp. PSN259]|nr:hypothetical protein QBC43DRAFT_339013 [Cladorrhinum sp. PSN259]
MAPHHDDSLTDPWDESIPDWDQFYPDWDHPYGASLSPLTNWTAILAPFIFMLVILGSIYIGQITYADTLQQEQARTRKNRGNQREEGHELDNWRQDWGQEWNENENENGNRSAGRQGNGRGGGQELGRDAAHWRDMPSPDGHGGGATWESR